MKVPEVYDGINVVLYDGNYRYNHFSEEKVLCLSVLGRLQEA